ncbi:MAG TPA: hypothetical protein VGM52_06170 [Herbaspirillum sp.]|jgi:hypothetical protein
MTTSHNKPKFFENFFVVSILTLLVAVLLLYVSHIFEENTEPIEKLVSVVTKEAGFACLVAFFLNLSIEWINRYRHSEQATTLVRLLDEKHQERMEMLLKELDKKYNETSKKLLKDVFQTVYERYIEKGIFKVIDDHVLKKDVMRKGYKMTMKLEQIPNENDLIGLTFYIHYKLVNLTDQPIEDVLLGVLIDVTPQHEDKCKFVTARIGDTEYSEEKLVALTTRDEVNAQWTLKISGRVEKGETLPVSLEYKKVGPRNYSEVMCTTVQMDSLEIEVLSLDGSLSVNAVSLHPENEVLTSPESMQNLKTWKIEHAILPGQGAIVFWHPQRDKIIPSQI